MTRRSAALLGGVVLLACMAAGCGSSETAATTTTTAAVAGPPLKARLHRAGYTVAPGVATALLRPRPAGAFLVRDVDWAAAGKTSFSVAVYVFASRGDAGLFAKALKAKFTPERGYGASFVKGHRTEVRGPRVYVAFTSMDEVICPAYGLCATYAGSSYGVPRCDSSGTNCIGPGPLSGADFRELIDTAEGV